MWDYLVALCGSEQLAAAHGLNNMLAAIGFHH